MADDGFISAEDFEQRRRQVLGYDVMLKRYAQDLERVKLDGMKLIDVINKDEEICRIAVKQSGWALKYVPEQYRTLEMCLLATAQKPYAITFVPGELVNAVAKENPSVFTDLAPKNIGACLAVIAENGLTLEHLPEKFHTPEIYLAAVTQNGLALQFVPEKQRTKNILLAAVQNTGMAVQFLPKTMNMSGQFAVVLWQKVITDACVSAVTQNGMALQVIPDKYRHHDDILLAAVTQNGLALQFVQESDKTKELCRAAVAQNKAALQFVPDKLKKKM
jgi:hemoglobin-like flavoprotein